jgi:RNA polymerase sigma factor (sigma-70 family)
MNRLLPRSAPAVQLRAALRSDLDALPDAELLDRFARYADHPAFESLLRRHGPMVHGVCRRLAGADADDAFQATFLVFLRKARSIRRGERLGPWLYGVAYRVALKARARAARLAAYRTEAIDMIPDPAPPADLPDWLPILDAELAALPAKYRDALVLCELQGASRAEAARTLGLREGTLSSRLSRGRELLRRRLLKHGTLLPAAGLAALLGTGGDGRATAPAALAANTSELAKVATGAAAGAVPVGAARLTDEVLKGMFLTKLRLAGAAVTLVALATVGLSAAAIPAEKPGQPPEEKGAAKGAVPATPPKGRPAAVAPKLPDREAVQGLWVLDKLDYDPGMAGPGEKEKIANQVKAMIGNMQFLVAGDIWWALHLITGGHADVAPMKVTLDPSKNPKWIDLWNLGTGDLTRGIYELTGDRLRICTRDEGGAARPAEFAPSGDVLLMVMEFRRDKLPPAAGDKALVGSWEKGPGPVKANGASPAPPQRLEILDGYLLLVARRGSAEHWTGGRYTVDTTKNPKWIDVELTVPLDNGQVTKLYGSYEVADGRLKMALGPKRATRPLEFGDAPDVLLFDVKATEPLSVLPFALPAAKGSAAPPRSKPATAPAPRPKAK